MKIFIKNQDTHKVRKNRNLYNSKRFQQLKMGEK